MNYLKHYLNEVLKNNFYEEKYQKHKEKQNAKYKDPNAENIDPKRNIKIHDLYSFKNRQ